MKVFIVAAISADGFIAQNTTQLADWTSKEDKKVFVELTKRAGVMVMGGTTFRTIGRALPGRRNIVYTRQAIDVEGIETTEELPVELLARLEKEGHTEVAIIGGRTIYDMFLQAGLVNEVYLTLEPVFFGDGIPLLTTPTRTSLRLKSDTKLNDDVILLQYEVVK